MIRFWENSSSRSPLRTLVNRARAVRCLVKGRRSGVPAGEEAWAGGGCRPDARDSPMPGLLSQGWACGCAAGSVCDPQASFLSQGAALEGLEKLKKAQMG